MTDHKSRAAAGTDESSAPILDVGGVAKSFGGLSVLSDISLRVNRGSIAGLVGPNGSGKSTLFDIITSYQAADRGTILFDGEDVTRLASHQVSRRGLVRTFQLTRVFPALTVAENLLVFATRGRSRADGEAKAAELLDFIGLMRLADHEAATLSYGQLKLLEIGQVLMLDPRMLMLDEPMAGVNPGLADEIVGRIKQLRDGGLTVLLVEHNLPVVLELCDHLTVLGGGAVMAQGSPREVLERSDVREAFLGE